MKYYYDRIANKYVALHNVNHKDIPAGYIEITEEEYNDHHFRGELEGFDYHFRGEEVVGIN